MTDAVIDYAGGVPVPARHGGAPDARAGVRGRQFVRGSGRLREQLVGRHVFDVFPDNSNDPAATGMRTLKASPYRALTTGERDAMALQRYDVGAPDRPGGGRSATGPR